MRKQLIVDSATAAKLFAVTTKSIAVWARDEGMPVVTEGGRGAGRRIKVDLLVVMPWFLARTSNDAARQRARRDKEMADRIALQNAEARGDLGRISVWGQELTKFLTEIRAQLLAVPAKLAPTLVGDVQQRHRIIETEIHDVLRKLSRYQFRD